MKRLASTLLAAAAAAVALTLAACSDRNPASPPSEDTPAAPGTPATPSAPGAPSSTGLLCTVQVRTATVSCDGVPSPTSAASPDLSPGYDGMLTPGGPRHVVTLINLAGMLTFSGTHYDESTETLSTDVAVENPIVQPLGTADGHTLSATGVRVIFEDGPVVTAGTGMVTIENADGVDAFTNATQPYFEYDQILFPGETTPPHEWRLSVPHSVEAFTFYLAVSGLIPRQAGWIRVSPIAPTLYAGESPMQLTATPFYWFGAESGDPVSWSSSDSTVVTVDSLGVARGISPGSATVTATSTLGRHGSVTVLVESGSNGPLPTVDSVALDRYRLRANGINTLVITAGVRVPDTGSASVAFTMTGPNPGDEQSCVASLVSATQNGPYQSAVYQCGITFPQGSTVGVWTLSTAVAGDTYGGFRILHTDKIVDAGGWPYMKVNRPPS